MIYAYASANPSPRAPMMGRLSGLAILCALVFGSPVRGEDGSGLRLLPAVTDESVESELPETATDTAEEVPAGTEELAAEVQIDSIWDDPFSWQNWLLPSHWKSPDGWDNSFEVGVDGSSGNSTTLTLRTGANLKRKKDWSDLKVAINYVKATAEEVETKHNAQLEIQHDWLLEDSRWSPFCKMIAVYDEFRSFRFETTLNAGMGYRFIDNDETTLKARFGSGATRKYRDANNTWEPEALVGVDFEHKFSDRQKLRATVEYYPEWMDFNMYRVRTDAGWEMLLDERTNMSLKLGVINRYDSRDSGPHPNALDYTLLLLWKM
jgi:putative salt-induced outer membrane protein YdiY